MTDQLRRPNNSLIKQAYRAQRVDNVALRESELRYLYLLVSGDVQKLRSGGAPEMLLAGISSRQKLSDALKKMGVPKV